jgi:hypothetical protein
MASMEAQITNTDDYSYRLDEDPITMGCYSAGRSWHEPVDGGTKLSLDKCTFTRGAPMTGTGNINDDLGTFRLDVRLGPRSHLRYFDNPMGQSVKGTYRRNGLFKR